MDKGKSVFDKVLYDESTSVASVTGLKILVLLGFGGVEFLWSGIPVLKTSASLLLTPIAGFLLIFNELLEEVEGIFIPLASIDDALDVL